MHRWVEMNGANVDSCQRAVPRGFYVQAIMPKREALFG